MPPEPHPPQGGPSFGVCIPTYEPLEGHLDALLDSLASQTHPPDEVVVSDDSSGDGVEQAARSWADRLPLRYHRNEQRLGIVGNWNNAVGLASTEWVVLAGQDDAYESRSVERVLDVIRLRPALVAVGVGRTVVDGAGHPIATSPRVNDRSRIFSPESVHVLDASTLAYLSLRNGNILGEPSCVAYRRTAWEQVGRYDDRLVQFIDVDFDIRLAQAGPVAYLASPLVRRRRHGENATAGNRRAGAIPRERHEMFRRWLATAEGAGSADDVRAAHLSYLTFDALLCVRTGDWSTLRSIAEAMRETGWPGLRSGAARAVEIARRSNPDHR